MFNLIPHKNTLLQPTPKIILGIDPGTLVMGYSVIAIQNNIITVKEMDVLRLSSKQDNYERLRKIHEKVCCLLSVHAPHEFAIEAPFFGKNVQSMLKLGRAQGVAIAAAMAAGIPVTEYSPKKVKQSITGNGNADKEQIWKMLRSLLLVDDRPQYLDASDALAVAVCHHYQFNSILPITEKKKSKSWAQFVLKNPGRVKI